MWSSHVSRSSAVAKTVLQSTVNGKEEGADRRKGGETLSKSGQGWTLPA